MAAIAGSFEMSRIAVMKHLAVLEGAGLVLSHKRGRERWRHLNFVPLRLIYERRGRQGGALLAQVSKILPGRRLELTGCLHFGVVFGDADFVLEAAGDETVLRFTHRAVRDIAEVSTAMIGGTWRSLLGRHLKKFVETGERLGIDGST